MNNDLQEIVRKGETISIEHLANQVSSTLGVDVKTVQCERHKIELNQVLTHQT